ncbi:MAG: hypothetical protein ACREL5_14320 [Gemmatimonadales bacterium]
MLPLLLAIHAMSGPAPRPAAASRYKIVSTTVTDIDATSLGQAAVTYTMTLSAYVSITVSDTSGGQLAQVVVDSSTYDAGDLTAMLPDAMREDAKGSVFHIYVVNGTAASSLVPTPMNLQAMQLVSGIEMLVKGMRQAKAGDSWVDTVRTDTTVAESAATGLRVYTWTAKPGAGNAMEFDANWTGSTKVGAAAVQMDMQLAGTSQLTTVPGMLASSATTTGSGHANMSMAGNTLPIKFKTDVTVNAVP